MRHEPTPLADRLHAALDLGDRALREIEHVEPSTRRDRILTLHRVHELHTAPLAQVGARVRWQHHPTVAALKMRLEASWIVELDAARTLPETPDDIVAEMKALAARDRSPSIYRWLASEADWESARHFLSLEGGPDDLFDDLVATCQVGLPLGPAKMELASNYWDEMGNGDFDHVHNVMYRRFVDAVELPEVPKAEQPTAVLERSALVGLVASNRALQAEMIGALGLIELEAGPHCRYVEQGLERLEAPEGARDFYRMHAAVDPLHGQGWLENGVTSLVAEFPDWGPRILRGAEWKSIVNRGFFAWAEQELVPLAA